MKLLDLTGERFGKWTVLAYHGGTRWSCRCDCGTISDLLGYTIRNGQSKGCRKCQNDYRLLPVRSCPECKQDFRPPRSAKKFCSARCAQNSASRELRSPPVITERSATKAAYFAGIIDGEGCIYFRPYGRTSTTGRYVAVEVRMTCEKTIQALADYFGGSCRPRKVAAPRKPQWSWRAASAAARAILAEVRPYLITKADRADAAIHNSGNSPRGTLSHKRKHDSLRTEDCQTAA